MKISIGFEAETQCLSIVHFNNSFNDKFWIETLSDKVMIYPDVLTETYEFNVKKIQPFLENIEKYTFDYLCISEYKILKKDMKHLFNNAEFIVTYSEPEEINNDNLIEFIIQKLKIAVEEIKSMIQKFNLIQKPEISSDLTQIFSRRVQFPYHSMAGSDEFDKLLLFFSQDPKKIGKFRFVFQCTLGIPILESINVMINLYSVAKKHKVIPRNKNHLKDILDIVNNIMFVGMFKEERKNFIRNYLFLFKYSYYSRFERKTGSEFVIRHSFALELSSFITLAEKREIENSISNIHHLKDLLDYFHYVHFNSQEDRSQLLKYQDISDVGLPKLFDGTTILIEFRLLNSILLNLVSKENMSFDLVDKI
jgi:hypothetical protein